MTLQKPSFIQTWLTATRPFALPASVMPVIFGSIIAYTEADIHFHWLRFIASLLGMAFLHTGSNLMNDVYDYKKGVDQQVNPVSGAVVRGWLSPKQALKGAFIFIILGSLLGLWIVSQVGILIFYLGLIGLIIGILYTWGPFPLKFNALGDLAVFLNFGILGALGAWTVQTGTLSWIPVVWSIPMSLLVIGILHANNWRDMISDKEANIKTVAMLLGDSGSKSYFRFLLFGPFFVIMTIIVIEQSLQVRSPMPWTFLITVVAIPLAVSLDKRSELRKDPQNIQKFLALDGSVAQFNLQFGLLCCMAAILSIWLG